MEDLLETREARVRALAGRQFEELGHLGLPARVDGGLLHRALRDTGWRNYSLFLRDDGLLIGYVEADDLAAAQAGMAATAVNARWQAEMAPFFADLDGRPDEGFLLLEEVFHLEDQIDRR